MAILLFIFMLLACPTLLQAQTAYEDLLAALFHLEPDASMVAPVDSLTIRREEAVFRLGPGEMILCTPVDGRVVAAVYRGSGEFSFKPPSTVEQGQLDRFFGTDSIVQEFEFLFLMFGDSTAGELDRGLT
ncbi:MAG: hypothetical protein OEV30_06625 [Ignavibacteria bacterium]|nr:hypothetical protein [Ignavibacteria bacterium]